MRRFQFAAEYYYFYSFVDTVGKSILLRGESDK